MFLHWDRLSTTVDDGLPLWDDPTLERSINNLFSNGWKLSQQIFSKFEINCKQGAIQIQSKISKIKDQVANLEYASLLAVFDAGNDETTGSVHCKTHVVRRLKSLINCLNVSPGSSKFHLIYIFMDVREI